MDQNGNPSVAPRTIEDTISTSKKATTTQKEVHKFFIPHTVLIGMSAATYAAIAILLKDNDISSPTKESLLLGTVLTALAGETILTLAQFIRITKTVTSKLEALGKNVFNLDLKN